MELLVVELVWFKLPPVPGLTEGSEGGCVTFVVVPFVAGLVLLSRGGIGGLTGGYVGFDELLELVAFCPIVLSPERQTVRDW